MRKILTFFALCMVITGGAFAGGTCYTESVKDGQPDYTIYFDVDSYSIKDNACLQELKTKLNSIKLERCRNIVLVGRTDATGTYLYNDRLSQNRVDYVKSLFTNSTLIAGIVAGEPAGETSMVNLGVSSQKYRVVRVYVGYDDTCTVNSSLDVADANIQGIIAGFKANSWRDSEGGLNKARLLSDSVAGVVLGTAGGLITSSVVKKNQIESGFEDLNCTIGGQVVAGFGDEFTVGNNVDVTDDTDTESE